MSRNSGHISDSKRYYDWLYHAFQDKISAETLISDERLYGQVIFHCQQAIEKSLKAYLIYKTRKFHDGHNITWLCKQAALLDREFSDWITKFSSMNRYYIETRYPADIPTEITYDDAKKILDETQELTSFIFDSLGFSYKRYRIKKK